MNFLEEPQKRDTDGEKRKDSVVQFLDVLSQDEESALGSALQNLQVELGQMPEAIRSYARLYLSARLIEASAYEVAYEKPGNVSVRLFLLAAEIEKEIERLRSAP